MKTTDTSKMHTRQFDAPCGKQLTSCSTRNNCAFLKKNTLKSIFLLIVFGSQKKQKLLLSMIVACLNDTSRAVRENETLAPEPNKGVLEQF